MKINILIFSLVPIIALAGEVHIYKDSDGSTILSGRESNKTDYQKVKTIKYEDALSRAWKPYCSKDAFTGSKKCSMNYQDVQVSLIDGKYGVYIGRNHFPRTQSAIRVDGNVPIYGYEGISKSPKIVIEQMKKGKTAYTRYQEWPYKYNQDGEADLTGFAESFNKMLEQYKAL